jgi:hypothetical protein
MKKLVLSVALILSALNFCLAQDLITKRSGEDVKAKILEINPGDIKFKNFENLDGPTVTILKSEILMVRYANGTKDIFSASRSNNTSQSFDHKTVFKLGSSVLLPTGILAYGAKAGVGLNGSIIAPIATDINFVGDFGVGAFFAESSSIFSIPVLAGIRYENNVILGFSIGLNTYIGGGDTSVGFGFSPQLGYSFGKIDLIGKYITSSHFGFPFNYISIGTYFKL